MRYGYLTLSYSEQGTLWAAWIFLAVITQGAPWQVKRPLKGVSPLHLLSPLTVCSPNSRLLSFSRLFLGTIISPMFLTAQEQHWSPSPWIDRSSAGSQHVGHHRLLWTGCIFEIIDQPASSVSLNMTQDNHDTYCLVVFPQIICCESTDFS